VDERVLSLSRELAEVGRLAEDDDVNTVVDRMVIRARQTIPGCAHATVTVINTDGTLETLAGTEPSAVAHRADERPPWPGPIQDAIRYREPRRVDDARLESRWPGFNERMRLSGLRSCLALPLPARRHPSVGFTLFSAEAGQFSEHALDLVVLFALHAGTAFDNADLYNNSRQLIDHLHRALASRDVIGQAQGVLMHRFGAGADAVFQRLRDASQRQNVKVRDLAADLVRAHRDGELEPLLGRVFPPIEPGKTARV
jgi:GAF domain-containing protein